MLQAIFSDGRAAGERLLANKEARALARARAILAAGGAARDIADELNTGKLLKLMVWQVETILKELREKRLPLRGTRIRIPAERRRGQEKQGALVGDFCYSICRQDREEPAGTV